MVNKNGNPQNLDPVRSTNEARKRGRAGGLASGRARREKRTMREIAQLALSMPLNKGKVESLAGAESLKDATIMNLPSGEIIILRMVQEATNGNIRAAEYLRDTIGEDANQQTVSPLDRLAQVLEKYAEDDDDE